MPSRRLLVATLLTAGITAVGAGLPARAQLDPVTRGQLEIRGNRLTLFADELTTDAEQTINVAEPARVRTCFGALEAPCGTVAAGDPQVGVPGVNPLKVVAELRGPELPQPVRLETVPGGAFVVPGFQQEGDYFLENIRLVAVGEGGTAGGQDQVIGFAEPPVAVLHVRRIVLTSAKVRQLSLAELEARGISLSEENFQAFNFAVGFAFEDEIVEVEFPVLFEGNGVASPLDGEVVKLDGLPPDVVQTVGRWQPPHLVPFRLEVPEKEALEVAEEERQDLNLPLFGAIVLPGTVTYLNQFFDAQLIVANGAPVGSEVTLENLHGAIRLADGNVLRLAQTEPPVALGQEVPVISATGGRVLRSGDEGTASWTVEGLKAGTHTVQMDITGDLVRPGREPLPVLSRAQAAVEVVDARFNLTFSHPGVVREAEAYTLFVTVTNLSQATQNLITVELKSELLTGAHPEDPLDDLRRTLETLPPGQAETVEFRLVADVTGKVVATTFQSDSASGQGTLVLRAGVGELGIPLSPATLLLPRFSDRLGAPHRDDDELLRANVRLLGLAYSLAVAPAGRIPPGLPRVIKTDVERRAIDLAEAGQRTFLHDGLLESLQVLALDQLGNRHPLFEFDALRRQTSKGLEAAAQLARALRSEQTARGLGGLDFLDHFAETTSYARPYLAAMVVPSAGQAPPVLSVDLPGTGGGSLVHTSEDESQAVRTLPFGEVYAVHRTAGGSDTVPFALVGRVEPDDEYQVVLTNPTAERAAGRLVVIVAAGTSGDFRRIDLGTIELPPLTGAAVTVGAGVADPAGGGFRLFDPESGVALSAVPSPSRSSVPLPPFRLIGAVQDFRLAESGPDSNGNIHRPNRYGNGITYLFNRPPERAAAETPQSYRIRSSWSGLDVAGAAAQGVSEKVGAAAFFQTHSERVVNVRYTSFISALLDLDGTPLVEHEHFLDTLALVDPRGHALSSLVPPPTIESDPVHVGGLVDGRVLRGTGEAVPGAVVQLLRTRTARLGSLVQVDIAGETTTDAQGRFFFDYVENPSWDGQIGRKFVLRATVPPGDDPDLEPGDTQEVASFIRLQNRLAHVNIALLGRGTVEGTLVYQDDQRGVVGGSVSAASILFSEAQHQVVSGLDGGFRFSGLPVGPITLSGRDEEGRRVYATVGIEKPGDRVEVKLELPRTPPPGLGTVRGKVLRQELGGSGEPPRAVQGAQVAVYSEGNVLSQVETDEFGNFRFDDVPEGRVSLQASDFRVSRTSVFTDLVLSPGETAEVELTLPDGDTRTVSGRVEFLDPLTNTTVPIVGAVAFVEPPGVFAHTDSQGRYVIAGVPVQAPGEAYRLTAIDFQRKLQGEVLLPPVLDTSPDEIAAQPIVLREMRGGIDGVVLDPLGRPVPGAGVGVFPFVQTITGIDGSFSFDDLPVGNWTVTAHVGDGLAPGRVGYFGEATTRIVFAGHRPFVTVSMRGSGVVTVLTRTASSGGVLTPVFYRPTFFSEAAKQVTLRGQFIEKTTDPNGRLEIVLPVGEFELVAFNPFHGLQERRGEIAYPGQVKDFEIVFEQASTVQGQVLDVDGTTPVADIPVTLHTETLKPQSQRTDAQGHFQFQLVPKGNVSVRAEGLVGTVERVGRSDGVVTMDGQTLELEVGMKAQGTVRGQILEQVGADLLPLPGAQFFIQENSYPYRRLPAPGSFFLADSQGRYEVPHLYAGRVTLVARDPIQVTRRGSVFATLTTDWQVLDMPDMVLSAAVGSLTVVVRDAETGGPVADAQVRLSNQEVTVTDGEGVALFDALALDTYSVYAFFAPTGQSGRVGNLRLTSSGQALGTTVFLDQRGEIRGTVFDDEALSFPVPGATVSLGGFTSGGRLTALATTSGAAEDLGRFSFLGIPEGSFSLTAALQDTVRRASAQVTLTETAPIADVNLVLEPVTDVYVRLYEKLTAGVTPVDLAGGIFSVRLLQGTGVQRSYDFTRLTPQPGSDVYFFPDVLSRRGLSLTAQELAGEQRSRSLSGSLTGGSLAVGSGTLADPFQIVLDPKGVVRVTVHDALGSPVPEANVTLHSSGGGRSPGVTGDDGSAIFLAVSAGALTATATRPLTGFGGLAKSSLTFDDEVVEILVTLAPSVRAHGVVYQPLPDDRVGGEAAPLVPQAGALVEIRDSRGNLQQTVSAADGTYRFQALSLGDFTLRAQSLNGDLLAKAAGGLVGPDGTDNALPAMILDASPPRILSLVPPPGLEGVSRTAAVEIVFSEALNAAVLPTGQPTSNFFELRSASGTLAAGSWSSFPSAAGEQVVRFVPSEPYLNLTVYSLVLKGGPSGIRDAADRPLTPFGDVGSNFKTSDSVGPTVTATLPDLTAPVDPQVPIRVDFNEAVVATPEQLDGDGVGDAAVLSLIRADGALVSLPVSLFLTRGNFSLVVQPVAGFEVAGDTGNRRLEVAGLADSFGNVMPSFQADFRIFDDTAPVIVEVPFPDGAPDGKLNQGRSYTLTPVLGNVEDATPSNPGGDIGRVEYFFQDPTDPASPSRPSFEATGFPFSYTFIGAYSGNGTDPRPFPVWVRAVDTSTNESNVVRVDMEVLPNLPPAIETVEVTAVFPVPGTFYAGSTLQTTVRGFSDPDGSQLTLSTELFEAGASDPLVESAPRLLTRPAGGWADAGSESFLLTLPIDLAEGTRLQVRARVLDAQGGLATGESLVFAVADDTEPPTIDNLVALGEGGSAGLTFFIGDTFLLRFRVQDAETEVETVEVTVDRTDLFPAPLTATRQPGAPDRFATSPLTVPTTGVTGTTPLTFTLVARDRGENTRQRTFTVELAPEPDPTAPTVEWVMPWQGAPWPADYRSVVPAQGGVPLLLRVLAEDTALDAAGQEVPGSIVEVLFRGPVVGASGLELAAVGIPATLVAGTGEAGRGLYELLWTLPDAIPVGSEIPFTVEAFDSGGKSAVRPLTLTAEAPRRVYEGVVTAVLPSDEMLAPDGSEDGLVFLLGSTLSLFEQPDGSLRRLPGMVLYTGGKLGPNGQLMAAPSVLTAPEITSYSSSIPFHPLELSLDRLFAVGAESRVDQSGRGLLGSTSTQFITLSGPLAGQTRAESLAGGSHGGNGWFGSPGGGWDRLDLTQPGSVYDNLRDPKLAGGGGASDNSSPGGSGGGVVRLFAPQGTVRLVGDVLALGGSGSGGGGAGGAIHIAARRLVGDGAIDASGGAGSNVSKSGGGGGGRVSVRYAELSSEVDLEAQISVTGGPNHGTSQSGDLRFAGAGTVYVEVLDSVTGEALGPGEVRVANRSGQAAATTPLPALDEGLLTAVDADVGSAVLTLEAAAQGAASRGNLVGDQVVLEDAGGEVLTLFPITAQERLFDPAAPEIVRIRLTVAVADAAELQELHARLASGSPVSAHSRSRFAALTATGATRLVADGDLVLGVAQDPQPTLNDRSSVVLDGEARVLLRGEGPGLTATALAPADGTDVRLGSTVQVTWTAQDPLGFGQSVDSFAAGDTTVRRFDGEPLAIASSASPLDVTVPVDTPAGAASYTVEVRDLAGRTASAALTWNVLENAPPVGSLRVADSAPATVRAGGSIGLEVRAEDLEGLAEVVLLATGPVNEASQTVTTGGQVQDLDFTLSVPATADGSQPVVVEARITDIVGTSVTTAPLTLSVLPNQAASGTLSLAPGAPGAVKPGQSTTVQVHAEDPDGLATIELLAVGPATQPLQTLPASGTVEDASFAVTVRGDAAVGPITLTARLTDVFGITFEIPSLTLQVVENALPTGRVELAPGTPPQVLPATTVTVLVHAEDEEGLERIVLNAGGPVTPASQSQTVSGTTVDTSFQVTLEPTAQAGETVVLSAQIFDAFGAPATVTESVTLGVLADTQAPAVTVSGVAPSYAAGETLTATISSSDDVGVRRLDVTFDGQTQAIQDPETSVTFTATVDPTLTVARSTTFLVTATDFQGNTSQPVEIPVELRPDASPLVTVEVTSASSLLPGETLAVSVTAEDDVSVSTIAFTLSGAETRQRVDSVDSPQAVRAFQHTLSLDLLGGELLDLRIDVTDSFGHVEGETVTFTVLADVEAPTVSLELDPPSADDTYTSGDTVTVRATAQDNVSVATLSLTVNGDAVTGPSPLEFLWTVPGVANPTPAAIIAEATDPAGNLATLTRTVTVAPVFDPDQPTLRFTCGTAGALLAPNTSIKIAVDAQDDQGVEKVEFFLDGDPSPVATRSASPYDFTLTAPAGAVEGDVIQVRAVVSDFGTKTAEARVDVRVVEGTVLSGDFTLAADDFGLDGLTVIVTGGTLTVAGPHTFRDLVVLGGAAVTHPATTTATEHRLELSLFRDLYVACDGSISATGRGYLGGSVFSARPAHSYPNTPDEGAPLNTGGSHGGPGGGFQGLNPAYGSLFDPRDPGAGGGGHSNGASPAGGGVIRIHATGTVVIDGALTANGGATGSNRPGGAAGSIRLDGLSVSGGGDVQASGTPSRQAGAGGRIALYGTSVDPALVARARALGGGQNTTKSAPGTLFVKTDDQAFGDLIINDQGLASSQITELLPVGAGVIDQVTASSFTDFEADFRHSLVGAEVAFGGDFSQLWTITGHDHHGRTLELDVSQRPLTVQPGDTYQGVYRFDGVTVRGSSRVVARDAVITTEAPVVEAGSLWLPGYQPSLSLTSPAAGSQFTAGQDVTLSALVDDVFLFGEVRFGLGGTTAVDTTVPYSVVLPAPVVAAPTTVEVSAAVSDVAGNDLVASLLITVVPSSDATPPVVTLDACPTDGDVVAAGEPVTLGFAITDDQRIESYSLIVDGEVVETVATAQAQVDSQFLFTPPVTAAAGTVFQLEIRARDFGGNVAQAALSLSLPSVAPLTGAQDLTSIFNGQPLVLGPGTFTVLEPLSLPSLSLMAGAQLVGVAGESLHLTVAGALRVQCGAAIEVGGQGFAGGSLGHADGFAPTGVGPSQPDAGGSHGGRGSKGDLDLAGEVYDSVYLPRFGGGGGALNNPADDRVAGAGGGVVHLEVGELVLGGEILAKGEETRRSNTASGAGGSVVVEGGGIRGGGLIDASGGIAEACRSSRTGAGGGGRVALVMDALVDFDPALQVKAIGGWRSECNRIREYAGPGTVFAFLPTSTYGDLYVDQEGAGGLPVPVTVLPSIGTSNVGLTEADPVDATALWIEPADPNQFFSLGVVGMWVRVAGVDYRVADEDPARRRLLLAGAAGEVSVGDAFQGVYKFDKVQVEGGAIVEFRDVAEVENLIVDPDSQVIVP